MTVKREFWSAIDNISNKRLWELRRDKARYVHLFEEVVCFCLGYPWFGSPSRDELDAEEEPLTRFRTDSLSLRGCTVGAGLPLYLLWSLRNSSTRVLEVEDPRLLVFPGGIASVQVGVVRGRGVFHKMMSVLWW